MFICVLNFTNVFGNTKKDMDKIDCIKLSVFHDIQDKVIQFELCFEDTAIKANNTVYDSVLSNRFKVDVYKLVGGKFCVDFFKKRGYYLIFSSYDDFFIVKTRVFISNPRRIPIPLIIYYLISENEVKSLIDLRNGQKIRGLCDNNHQTFMLNDGRCLVAETKYKSPSEFLSGSIYPTIDDVKNAKIIDNTDDEEDDFDEFVFSPRLVSVFLNKDLSIRVLSCCKKDFFELSKEKFRSEKISSFIECYLMKNGKFGLKFDEKLYFIFDNEEALNVFLSYNSNKISFPDLNVIFSTFYSNFSNSNLDTNKTISNISDVLKIDRIRLDLSMNSLDLLDSLLNEYLFDYTFLDLLLRDIVIYTNFVFSKEIGGILILEKPEVSSNVFLPYVLYDKKRIEINHYILKGLHSDKYKRDFSLSSIVIGILLVEKK